MTTPGCEVPDYIVHASSALLASLVLTSAFLAVEALVNWVRKHIHVLKVVDHLFEAAIVGGVEGAAVTYFVCRFLHHT